MRQRRLPQNEMAVWTVMGDHATDEDGSRCFVGQDTIARETGYSARNVRRIMRKLEERGAIVEAKKPGFQTTRTYRVVVEAVPLDPRSIRPDSLSGLESSKTARVSQTGQVDRQDRTNERADRTNGAARPDSLSAKPSESSKNPEKKNPQTRARESITEDEDQSENQKRETLVNKAEARALQDQRNLMFKSKLYAEDELFSLKNKTVSELKEIHAERERVRVNKQHGVTQVRAEPEKYAAYGRK